MNNGVNGWQIGGSHYAQGGNVQHWDFISLNNMSYLEGCATKYIIRWRKKHGLQDLEKAKHYIQKMVSLVQDGKLEPPLHRHRGPMAVPVADFSRANGLDAWEQNLVFALTYWPTVDALLTVIDRIDDQIAELRPATATVDL